MSEARKQRVAAYVVITKGSEILLCRLSPKVTDEEIWHLPGGGVDFGEHPEEAVVREVWEETGLEVEVGPSVRVDSARSGVAGERHALRLFYDGWLVDPTHSTPEVQEVDGSTIDARWFPLEAVRDGALPLSGAARFALDHLAVARVQRVSAYALAVRGDAVLLTRISARGHLPGAWTLPGGGVDHGEAPADAVRREAFEETGLEVAVGALLGAPDIHLTGTAPNGRIEDYHGIQLVYWAAAEGEPVVTERGGTTDAAAWVPISEIRDGRVEVLAVVEAALELATASRNPDKTQGERSR